MDVLLRDAVRKRAADQCEYCLMPQEFDVLPFQVDHITSQKHHGATVLENLAWSCCNCNAAKGSNIAGLDSETGTLTRLFDPRKDEWRGHFAYLDPLLVGLTAIGRTTVDVLNMNAPDRMAFRRLLMDAGLLPST